MTTCKNCRKDIRNLRADAKYCSIKCRNYYNHKNNYEKYLYTVTKTRATKRNIPFNLDIEDIVVPKKCPVFNIPLKRGKGAMSNNSPSIDKIIPELGYIKGNVWIISMKANRVKTDLTKNELKTFANIILNKIKEVEIKFPSTNV